jgi:hypothetical protein
MFDYSRRGLLVALILPHLLCMLLFVYALEVDEIQEDTCMYVHIDMYVYVCLYTQRNIYKRTYIHTYMHMRVEMWSSFFAATKRTYTQVYMHEYYMYT